MVQIIENGGHVVASDAGTTIDHGSLLGLGDDDHTQYLLIDGTRAMTGNLDLGNNNLLNPGTGHDAFTDFVANEHIDWTSASVDLYTTGNVTGDTSLISKILTLTNTGSADTYTDLSLGTSGGDPFSRWGISGGSNYSFGVDNSDSDKLKLTTGTAFSATPSGGVGITDILEIDSSSVNFLVTPSVDSLTANRLIASDGSKNISSVSDLTTWIAGTSNQVSVADDGDGTVTLSTPQNIHTGASPTFVNLTLTNDLTVQDIDLSGNFEITSTNPTIKFLESDVADKNYWIGVNGGDCYFTQRTDAGTITVIPLAFHDNDRAEFGYKVDLNGFELILDADADTSITSDTDDRIDFKQGGADTIRFGPTQTTFNVPFSDVDVYLYGDSVSQYFLWNANPGYVQINTDSGASSSLVLNQSTLAGANYLDYREAGTSQWLVGRNGSDEFAIISQVGGFNLGNQLRIQNGTTVLNENGSDQDIRIEGDTDANLLFTDAGNDRVGIGTATPSAKLDINDPTIEQNGTKYTVDSSAPGSPSDGDKWFDTTDEMLWVYDTSINSGSWKSSQLFTVTPDQQVNISASTTQYLFPITNHAGTAYDVVLEQFSTTTYVSTTNDATNYWNISLQTLTDTNSPSTIRLLTTQSNTASNWVHEQNTVSTFFDVSTTSIRLLAITWGKVASAGNLYGVSRVEYRLVKP